MRTWQQALHPLGPVGAQGIAQACNLFFQLGLIALLGRDRFADLGLGLVGVNTVVFLGEVGLGSYFLRESARSSDWLHPWRHLAGSRLIVVAAVAVIAWIALGWGAPNPEQARTVLIAAIPGLILSTFNPTPLLFGLGKVRLASAGLVCRFGLQACVGILAAWLWPQSAGIGTGLAFSIGILAPMLLGQAGGLPKTAMLPLWPTAIPHSALRLWGVSLAGIVNERALPFVIGNSRPEILATALIVLQVLQALIGIGGQIDRLLVPAVARGEKITSLWNGLRRIIPAFIMAIPMALSLLAFMFYREQLLASALLGMEWVAVMVGALAFSMAFARNKERHAALFILIAAPLSTVLQILLADTVPLEAILGLRIVVAGMAAMLALREITGLRGAAS